jgi:serine/threonine protein kinase
VSLTTGRSSSNTDDSMNHQQKSETAIYSNFVKVNNSHTNNNNTTTNDVFQKYTIVQNFGSGSMGAVYKVKLKHDTNHMKREKKRSGLFTLLRSTFTTSTKSPSPPNAPQRGLPQEDERERDREIEVEENGGSNSKNDDEKEDEDDDDCYALKCIAFDRISTEFIEELQNEIRILKNMDHPNIVKAYEVFYEYDKKKKRNMLSSATSTDHIKMLYVVMELCTGGDLYSRTPYSEKDAAKIVTQLLSAVWYVLYRSSVYIHSPYILSLTIFWLFLPQLYARSRYRPS